MKATIDGITYEGSEEEIRHIVENPPHRPPVQVSWPARDYPRHWDGSPVLTCSTIAKTVDGETVGTSRTIDVPDGRQALGRAEEGEEK